MYSEVSQCQSHLTVDHPRMLHNFRDGQSVVNITVEHPSDQVDAVLREREEGDPERMVQDLINVVEWILLVDDGV